MFSRKQRAQLNQILFVALVAMVLNLAVPFRAKAHITSAAASGYSNAVIARLTAPRVPLAALSTLPVSQEKPIIVTKKLVVRASAYTSSRWETDSDPFTTASGTKVHDGTIAANGLPFGAKVRLPDYFGDKIFTVEDRMNAKWGNRRVDIWMTDRSQALEWGVRTVTIEIVS